MSTSSALVLLLPEAEATVGAFRARRDPAARTGAPAHVTLLYPFLPASRLDAPTRARLEHLFAEQAPFAVTLTDFGRFPGVLYLVPEPADRLRSLTGAVWHAFPRYPPYGARHDKIVPHLCLAQSDAEGALDRIEEEARREIAPRLPIRAQARAVSLVSESEGHWREHARFPLTGNPP